MSIHVDEVTSEVIPEPEPAEATAVQAGGSTWTEEDRWRALQQRVSMDRARTRARGFDA